MIEDFRYAFRQFRKNPGFTAIALLTLGLGIGAAAAIFALIQGVLLSPPPYADPDRLVLVSPARSDGKPYNGGSTIGQWMAWRASARTLEAPVMYRWTFNFVVLSDGSQSVGGMAVTPDYFRVLGLKPLLGREFVEGEEAKPNSPPKAIILGYELWQRLFNGDPHIVGTTVRLSRMQAPLPVVGVMPPGVRFLPDPNNSSEPNYDVNAFVDFWLAATPNEAQPKDRGWNVVSRLRDGATVAQARAEIAAITVNHARTDTDLDGLTAAVRTLPEERNQEGRRLLMPLFASVALVFLIACGNVAGLLLGRGLQRQQEYAMRSALGAGRWRLFRQVLMESVALALVSAVVGLAVAVGLVAVLKAIGGRAVPRLETVTVGWPVFLFGFVAALLAAVLAGLLPAVRASQPDQFQGLEGSRTSVGRRERRLLGAVTTLQIVLTVALLAGAALLVRTAQNLANLRPGYDTENILTMTVTAMRQDGWKDFHARALERVSALPGVTHASFVWGLPLTGNKWSSDMEIVGQSAGSSRLADRLNLPLRAITPDYFDTMGMALIDGRGFRPTDDDKTPRVAVINKTFARRAFGDATPIGKQMRFAGDTKNTIEIVGVVSDTRTEALSEQAEPEIYFPLWQMRAFSKHLILRAKSDPIALAALVRRELHAIDPTAAVEHVQTMADIRRESVAPRTFAMQLLTGFSLAASLLALVGIYGVLSLSVGARTKEIAVRKAIGAQRSEILRLVLGEGIRLIALGVLLGTIVALLLGSLLQALLFEVQPTDPITLAGAAMLFTIVALLACVLPAWRAARVDLMEALRQA
jgi:putative ABC transport system permease protein